MKKTQKKYLGFAGLLAVAGMTTVAANIPSPEAKAISAITETIEVRVVGDTPAVSLESAVDGKSISSSTFALDLNYENATKVTLYRTLVGSDEGPVQIAVFDDLNYDAGSLRNLKFSLDKYGKYIITAEAIGYDNAPAPEEYIKFDFVPVVASLGTNPVTGKYEVAIDSYGEDVKEIKIYLGDTLLNTLSYNEFSDITAFSLAGQPSGTYMVKVVARNASGETIYIPFEIEIKYEATVVPDAGSPDTGGLFRNLNISREDYMITGLIVFFVLGIVAFGIVAKGRRSSKK